MTKEEKIQEALGIYHIHANKDGWISSESLEYVNAYHGLRCEKEAKKEDDVCYWRPKSLQGIENNNGWIKIESEDDLPKQENNLWLLLSDGSCILGDYNIFQKKFRHRLEGVCTDDEVTHYQPIEKPQPPLY